MNPIPQQSSGDADLQRAGQRGNAIPSLVSHSMLAKVTVLMVDILWAPYSAMTSMSHSDGRGVTIHSHKTSPGMFVEAGFHCHVQA